MIYKMDYFAVFQYVFPMKSFTRKLSSPKKPLSEILTQKKLRIYQKNFKLYVPKVVELTAARKELILLLLYLGQQSFEI